METIEIEYTFIWPNREKETCRLVFDADTLDIVTSPPTTLPPWSRLDFHQCPHCPLDIKKYPRCPLAVRLVEINQLFANLESFEKVAVKVRTNERTYEKQGATAQQALSPLLGLIIPCSGCPHTRFFRPMARFHLPFASEQETIYRASSMYLLAQYFVQKEGGKPDLDLTGLNDIYKQFQEINTCCAARLRDPALKDSTLNAIILLDVFAKTMPFAIKKALDELCYLFKPFLKPA